MIAGLSIEGWEALGTYRNLAGHSIFTVDIGAVESEDFEPLLVIHGFPTSSFDFHLVLDTLAQRRRVLLLDMLGYGLSAKPDIPYPLDLQADIVAAFTDTLGVGELALLTHDVGDTVGGELLARHMEGRWAVDVTRRVLTNGSIYIEMAHLSTGQELLLSLPDERLPDTMPINGEGMAASLAGTFSPSTVVDDDELQALWELIARSDGHLILPRLIRYIEERRLRQERFTGAIESHPSPLSVVWGLDDPIAVASMVDRLVAAVPSAAVTRLDGVGHYPMIESPERFATAVVAGLG